MGGVSGPSLALTEKEKGCPPDFLAISAILTASPELDPTMAPRVWHALITKDDAFVGRYRRLSEEMAAYRIRSWPDYEASGLSAQKEIHSIAVAVVGAWYLGRVGEVLPRSEINTPAFITYEGALMWRSTRDVTVIPTYARGGPGFWAEAPSSVKTD